jgi:WD40 repeat protein
VFNCCLFQITLWDPKAGKILRLLKGHDDTVKKAVFAPINKYNPNNMLATGMPAGLEIEHEVMSVCC